MGGMGIGNGGAAGIVAGLLAPVVTVLADNGVVRGGRVRSQTEFGNEERRAAVGGCGPLGAGDAVDSNRLLRASGVAEHRRPEVDGYLLRSTATG
jgi:hypothetical protein